ncbi:unnamed protein product [Adineta ricciae]|uniref:Uncharacterized protein n=1 Tax=Adineta ricciae TaxID=249248 RepID=A0A814Z5P4_ADIRI|nr:unnamed protein product [Adineta ricciae]
MKSSTISDTTTTLTQSSTTLTETISLTPKPCRIQKVSYLFIDDVHDILYVADTNNNRIQKYFLYQIDHSTGLSTGINVARKNLLLPHCIFIDTRTEEMYILDFELRDHASYRVHS